VDLVYNYVNGNDIEWIERRNKYGQNNNNHVCRFRDNGELRYSLRSVEKYAPWIQNIYIVMDSKVPEWLNESKVHIIRHEDIMPRELLPCYNSNVIEFHIDNIPGLSDLFIYANDDMFFGNYVDECFFVQNGKPVIRMHERIVTPNSYYTNAIHNAQMAFQRKYNVLYNLTPSHAMDVYSKSSIKECKKVFAKDLSEFYSNRLRSDTDIQRVLYQYFLIMNNDCILKTQPHPSSFMKKSFYALRRILRPSQYLDFVTYKFDSFQKDMLSSIYMSRRPKLVCLNDSELATEDDINRYHKYMDKRFGDISVFENV